MCPLNGSSTRPPASLPGVPSARVSPVRWYYREAKTSRRSSRVASLPSLGDTTCAVPFVPQSRTAATRPGVVHPVLRRKSTWKRRNLPRSWRTPLVPLPCSSTSAHPTALALANRRHGPRFFDNEGDARQSSFRGSITRLQDWLSTLRRAAHDARLASSRWLGVTGRAFHPQGSNKGFEAVLHPVPLSKH